MGIDHRTRSLLISLSDADLIRASEVPGLGKSWAHQAKTRYDDVLRGTDRSMRAIKTSMLRDSTVFIEALLVFWNVIEHKLECHPDEVGPDSLAYAARLASRDLGAAAAKVFLSGIAASDLELAAETAERFEELAALTADPLPNPEEPTEEFVHSEPTVEELLVATQSLRKEGSAIAERLRAAANSAECGRPAETMLDTLDSWSAKVQAHLTSTSRYGEAEGLVDLEDLLTAATAESAKRTEVARNALQTIEMLTSQGLDEMVPDLLRRLGFTSVEEVHRLAAFDALDAAEMDSDAVGTADHSDNKDLRTTDETELARSAVEASPADDSADSMHVERPATSERGPDIGWPVPSVTDVFDHQLADEAEASLGPPTSAEEAIDVANSPEAKAASHDAEYESRHPAAHAAGRDPSLMAEPESLAETTSALDEGQLPDFPWDEGSPPLLADLILHGRQALAYQVAAAVGETDTRQRLLKLACASSHCKADALELSLSQLVPSEADIESLDTNEVRVLLASALRASLILGYAPLGLSSLVERAGLVDTEFADLTTVLASLAQRGYRRDAGANSFGDENLVARWTELADEAGALVETLARKNTKYHRSTKVLHYLARDTQPVGSALRTAAELAAGVDGASDPRWTDLEATTEQLLDPADRERLIGDADERVSSAQQRRNPIVAGAKSQLHDTLSQAGDVLNRLLSVRRAILSVEDQGSITSVQDLNRALSEAAATIDVNTVGDAAMLSLVTWLRSEPCEPLGLSVDAELERGLERLYEVPRDLGGHPTRAATVAEVASLLAPRAEAEVVAGYLARGNISAARAFIADHGLEGEFDDQVLRAANDAKNTHNAAIAQAERVAARLRALGEDESALLVTEQIDAHRLLRQTDRFDLVIEPLQALASAAEQDLEVVRQRLRDATAAVSAPPESKVRILERIGRGDEALAVEYLTYLQDGQPLPDAEPTRGDDFGEFFPRIVEAATTAASSGQDVIAAARRERNVAGDPADQLKSGLEAWRQIKRDKRADDDKFRWSVAQMLRMVGLNPPAEGGWMREISRTQRSGFATFRVKAAPIDRSYVPQLGTEAHGSYDVTFVWNAVSAGRLLDFIDDRNVNRPNVIFYFGVLDVEERRQLRRETQPGRGKGFSPLVIDEAVVGWLSTLREPGWRFTQRVTLPFTTINPYTPFAGGEVPDEVFVGREDERRRIESPTGSMFVYGGRQLGKSALLRRVERMFTDAAYDPTSGPRIGNVALYVDLKAQGIGESQEPAAIWPLLGERLKGLGVIRPKERAYSAAEVTTHITTWLNAETSNRLLLLLDEADNFMTADANARASGAGGAFPVLQALKGVMESSHRRFKPVFAGLHQVQRFHDTSNTPVAHGGEDILIGALGNSDAYSLVVDPMNALGYQFETPESVWRLLLVTNYQASLVQIVCEALVKHVQGRQLPDHGEGVRIVIDEKDVQDVCGKQSVRDLMAQRFRWTINLDSRYRVIALVVALNSIDDGPGLTLTVDHLREQCETFWPAGFDPIELSRKEFERYLEEMVGLRVLRRHDGRYGLRSPYIIQMLGTRDSLEHELLESAQHLERPLEYNPTMARQIIGDSTHVWSPRSPLTDSDLATLVGPNPGAPVQVVFGTAALGIDRVVDVLEDAAKVNGLKTVVLDLAEGLEPTKRQYTKGTHVVVAMNSSDTTLDLAEVCANLATLKNVTATVVVGPGSLADLDTLNVPVHQLRRWSITGLRGWYESPFEELKDRERLYRYTSGWPKLVEEVMLTYARGRSPEDALKALSDRLLDPDEAAKFLADCSIDTSVVSAWSEWFVSRDAENFVHSEPTTATDLTEALGHDAYQVLDELETLDVVTHREHRWTLDRVVAAAAEVSK